jgi:hypothetical protein
MRAREALIQARIRSQRQTCTLRAQIFETHYFGAGIAAWHPVMREASLFE